MKVILTLCLCAISALAQAHQHGAMPAASTADGSFNPYVFSDGKSGYYLVYVQRTAGRSDVMLKRSMDGKNFSEPVRVNDIAGDATVRNENPPKIAIGAKGEVYVVWGNERGRWKGNVRFARSTDGGKSFSPAIALNSDAAGEPAGHAFQSIAVDAKGRVFIAWIDERNKREGDRGAEIRMVTSEDGGGSFSDDRRIVSDVCECCRTALQIDREGRLFLSYRTVPPVGPMNRDILIARSEDGGKSFTPVTVSADGWELNGCPVVGPGLSLDDRGILTVVWFLGGGARPGLYYATSTDHGRTFSPRRLLDPEQRLGKHAQMVSIGEGRAFVAWDDSAAKSFTTSGILDIQTGKLHKGGLHEGLLYPTVALKGQVAVIAAMKAATREIVTFTESITSLSPVE